MVLLMTAAADVPDGGGEPPAVMTTAEAMAMPRPSPDRRLAYGPDALQFGELRLPDGPGPHPVTIVLHGGCWLAAYDLGYISGLAAALTDEGVATWSLEYRRVGDEGGGWPGTFLDVGLGADYLRSMASEYDLDLEHVATVGHSAGGHLALWLAARPGLAADDELRGADPLAIDGVVALAGIADLAAYASADGCGAAVAPLLGGTPHEVRDRVRRVSPVELLPLGVRQHLVVGELDAIVPPDHVRRYAETATAAGDAVTVVVVPAVGHFDPVDPDREAFTAVLEAVRSVLDLPAQARTQKERPRGEGSPGRE